MLWLIHFTYAFVHRWALLHRDAFVKVSEHAGISKHRDEIIEVSFIRFLQIINLVSANYYSTVASGMKYYFIPNIMVL